MKELYKLGAVKIPYLQINSIKNRYYDQVMGGRRKEAENGEDYNQDTKSKEVSYCN